MSQQIEVNVKTWLEGNYDESTQQAIRAMQSNNREELEDSFYQNLEFGTGGLRGIMGVGTNRINKYTIGMATQGFSNYLLKTYPGEKIAVAIGHDSRNNARFFAETTAQVFAANGIQVYLFESLRPTPELSFAIRNLSCNAGVVCTASHNPKEYNGYKAYWNDGGQLVPPHDVNVIKEVEAIQSIADVKYTGGEHLIQLIGKEMDAAYLQMVKSLSVYPEIIQSQSDLKIVYTPIHGTGIQLVPDVLKLYGFNQVTIVQEQATPDGNFPTVHYPNPEESETMQIGLQKARELDADILLGTDPDADRVGIGVKDNHGNWVLMIGGEESFGLMIGSLIRDKDAVSAVALLCEMAAYEKSKGKTLFEKLIELYIDYGFYYESLISITKKGMNGQKEIAEMMERFRNQPPAQLAGSSVVQLLDYQLQRATDLTTGTVTPIHLPKSNVLQFITEDGSKISARPSGTEPKIKFYFSVHDKLVTKQDFEKVLDKLKAKIETIIRDMQLQ
ncbi:MAG: phospho-sugar mutase [Gammaproteobacteria bacterium]|nr:phospho-sugar mutase [Gammaproteobacteria bacterium]